MSSSYITSGIKRKSNDVLNDPTRMKSVLHVFKTNEAKKQTANTAKHSDIQSKTSSTNNIIEKSKRRVEALCEYTSNEKIISSSFFHIFLLGKAFMSSGPLSPTQQRHILLQYTGIAGRYHEAIFTLFDQKQRRGNTIGINTVVRNNKDCFRQFSQLVNNDKFRKLLLKAKKNPKGKVAKKVMQIVTPVLTTGGSRTSLGSLERNDAIMKINAMCLRYGMPTLFLTIAIDDVNNFNS